MLAAPTRRVISTSPCGRAAPPGILANERTGHRLTDVPRMATYLEESSAGESGVDACSPAQSPEAHPKGQFCASLCGFQTPAKEHPEVIHVSKEHPEKWLNNAENRASGALQDFVSGVYLLLSTGASDRYGADRGCSAVQLWCRAGRGITRLADRGRLFGPNFPGRRFTGELVASRND